MQKNALSLQKNLMFLTNACQTFFGGIAELF